MRDDLTDACTRELSAWSAPDAGQDALRVDYLEHLRVRDRGWARSCPGAHLTASSLVCAVAERQVLLTLHRKLGRWLQTGGHVEPDDPSLPQAALREATEESGLPGLRIDPDPLLLSRHEVPCGPARPTFHLDVQFLVVADRLRAPQVSAESTDVRWFAPDELPETDDSVRDLVSAAALRVGWSVPGS